MNPVPGLKSMATGMTDAELELACEAESTGAYPWAHWTSEIYSLGKCLRFCTKYPRALPLFVYSDHGVGLHSHLFPHELKNQAKVHFTWYPVKEQRYKNLADKKVIMVVHPWISYRRMRGIKRSNHPRGTLVFFTHHVPGLEMIGHETEEYFEELRRLPDKFQPIVLCLHMSDIKEGKHKNLRRQGFPIVTAGNTLSANFVDRFYDLVTHYSYATSQVFGSQVAYCVELGVPYFFLGNRPTLINTSHTELPLGAVGYYDEIHAEYSKRAQVLFGAPIDSVSAEQRTFIEYILGLDGGLARWQVSWILWREFFRNWRQWREIFTPVLAQFLRKSGLFWLKRQLRRQLDKHKSKKGN